MIKVRQEAVEATTYGREKIEAGIQDNVFLVIIMLKGNPYKCHSGPGGKEPEQKATKEQRWESAFGGDYHQLLFSGRK